MHQGEFERLMQPFFYPEKDKNKASGLIDCLRNELLWFDVTCEQGLVHLGACSPAAGALSVGG